MGKPIEYARQGMHQIVEELCNDSYAREKTFVSVISFADEAQTLLPLQECGQFVMPELTIGGASGLDAGLELLMKEIDAKVAKTTVDKKGDWKPIIFLFTDGSSMENPETAIAKWQNKYRGRGKLVVVYTGTHCTPSENVMCFNPNGKNDFASVFRW